MRVLILSLLLVGCASRGFVPGDQAPEQIRKKVRVAANSAQCSSHGGTWYTVKNSDVFPAGGYCQFKTDDGGQRCNSSRDCEGYCELSFDDLQGESKPRCSAFVPPRWDRCVPGYFEKGKVLGRGECFGEDVEVQ